MGRKPKGKSGPKGGRPIELTDALLERIAGHVEKGNYVETAADLEGVSIHTVRQLLRAGAKEARKAAEDGRPVARGLARAVRFSQAIKRARAKAESEDLEAIQSDGSWQARAWRLERRQPDRWGRRERHDHRHAGPRGGPIPFAGYVVPPERLKDLSDQELDDLERLARKLGAGASDPGTDPGGASSPGS